MNRSRRACVASILGSQLRRSQRLPRRRRMNASPHHARHRGHFLSEPRILTIADHRFGLVRVEWELRQLLDGALHEGHLLSFCASSRRPNRACCFSPFRCAGRSLMSSRHTALGSRRDDQVVVARMDLDVTDQYHRQVAAECDPVAPRSHEIQSPSSLPKVHDVVPARQFLANDVAPASALRQVAHDRLPGAARGA